MLVKGIMEQSYPTIFADELATKTRATLRERKLRILPVVDEHKILVGVLTRSHLMQISSSKSTIRVKGLMTNNPFTVTPDLEAMQAMREMLRQNVWYAPVIKSPQDLSYLGMLGLENFIRASLENKFARLSTPLSDVMATQLLTCGPNDQLDNVWKLMTERSFAACPVVEKGKAVGIITEQNLLESGGTFPTFEATKGRFNAPTKVSFIMKTPAISLKPTNTLKEAASVMLDRNIGRIMVVDEKNNLIGIVDREDVVKAIIK